MIQSIDDLVSAVRREVKKRPDVIYGASNDSVTGCSYREGICNDGTFGCLFGQILLGSDGLPDDRCHGSHTFNTDGNIENVLRELWPEEDWDEDEKMAAADWCQSVQERQDEGETWGDAVDYADEQIELSYGMTPGDEP